jgi:hypothetical protein
MKSSVNPKETDMKSIKIHIVVFLISLILSAGILINKAAAFTEIMISPDDCTISIFLRKEFSVMTPPALTAWLNQVNGELATAVTQADIDWFTARRNEIQNVINNYPAVSDAQIEALAQKWKAEIENKWNAPNHMFDGHCRVRVVMAYVIRKENDPPHMGFDQIRIAPGDFRSYVEGDWNFDANGFSEFPYSNTVHGVWSMNTTDDYTAPHEAGHEMGLKDRYRDRPAGAGADIEPGYENDLYGGPAGAATRAQLGALQVVSVGADGSRINNLETILRGRRVLCPVGGTVQNPGSIIDYSNIPFPGRDKMPERPKEKCTECTPVPSPVTETPKDAAKPAEDTTKDTTSAEPTESVQYRQDKVEDVTVDTGIVYKETPAGRQIDISSLPRGKGIDLREWQVKDITLLVDGQKIKPRTKDNFYVDKKSSFRDPAVAVITAIGTQYRPYAKEAESGKVCPVTGKKLESEGQSRSGADEAIETAGMTAGLGLLVSQAKGTITGKKCSFSLDKETAGKLDGKDDYARITVINESKNITRTMKVPLQ